MKLFAKITLHNEQIIFISFKKYFFLFDKSILHLSQHIKVNIFAAKHYNIILQPKITSFE